MLFAFSRLGAVVLGIAIALLLHGCGQDDVPSVPQGWVDIYCSCSYNQTSEPNGTFNETNRDSCFAKSADVASRSFSPEDIDLCINESSETCDCVGEERFAVAGRAFLTGNGSCRASIDGGASDGWANFPAGSQAVDPILASHFLDVGIAEHASVASFARVVMEMISLAAPADLLDRTLAAGREEIRHAQMALSLARRWSPEDFRVGPLPGLEFRPVTLMDLANQTVFEAILGETPAALRAAVASSVAQDQHAREFWQLVALEERRHAELAWATVAWAVQAGQVQVQQGVLAALALCTPKPEHSEASGNLRYGLLTPALELEVTREASDLIKRLRSELQTLEDLPGFERRVQEHFAESAKKLQLQVAV